MDDEDCGDDSGGGCEGEGGNTIKKFQFIFYLFFTPFVYFLF